MVANDLTGTHRRSFLKLAGVGGLAATAGCVGFGGGGGGGSSPETITFGQPASLTGQWDFLQPGVTQATKAARQSINEAGGPLGADLKVVRRDTAVKPQKARQVFTQLVENDNAVAIIGLYSAEINPLWDFLQKQQVPIVTPWPGSTFLDTHGGDKRTPDNLDDDEWLWRTVVGDTVHTTGNARYTFDQGFDSVGVINVNTEGARSYVEGFLSAYKSNGGSVANRVETSIGQSSYQAALDRLFQADFNAFLVSFPLESAITMMTDWAAGGYGGTAILSDPLAQQKLADKVGSSLNGSWSALPAQSGPNYDTFLKAYKPVGDATINGWTVPAWDAMHATALAVERAGEASHDAIEQNLGPVTRKGGTKVATFAEGKKALANDEEINYQGAATPANYTEYGNVFGAVTIKRVKNGKFAKVDEVPAQEIRSFIADDQY